MVYDDDDLRRVDPVFADQRDAVREAMAKGAHITEGIDPGFRHGPGLHKITTASDDEPITRGQLERMFAAGDRELLATIFEMLGVPGAAAVRKARLQDADAEVGPKLREIRARARRRRGEE